MEKKKNSYSVSAASGFTDEGDGVVSFPDGLTITDSSTQRNGTRYDIESMTLDSYGMQLTADHEDKLTNLIGKVVGVKKNGNRVTVDKIVYAVKENPYAQLAYDLLKGGFSNSFSIETLGRLDLDTGVYLNAELCGLSQVVVPNNYSAHVNKFNEVVHNSLEKAEANGLNVDGLEEKIVNAPKEEDMAKNQKSPVATEEFVDVKLNATEVQVPEAPVEEAPEVETPAIQNPSPDSTTDVEEPAPQADAPTPEVEQPVEEPEAPVVENAVVDEPEAEEEKPVKETTETKREKQENGTWIETVTTTRTSEYIESEEEKAEREAREARWEEERKADDADVKITVAVDTDENASDAKVENAAEEGDDTPTEEPVEKPVAEEPVVENKAVTEEVVVDKTENKKEIEMTKEEVQALIDGAVQNALDSKVEEPAFKEAPVSKEATIKNQFALAVASTRDLNIDAHNQLRELNKANLEALVDAGKVENSIKLEDLGNLVMGPDVLDEVQGRMNSYRALIDATEWRETNALKFAWLSRGNTVDMQNVSTGYSGGLTTGPIDDDDLLKPYGEPTWAPHDDELEELAYVTAVALATIKFAAVDIMADIAKQFTLDYDKKRAQLVIARLQQAVDANGGGTAYSGSSADLSTAIAEAADSTTVGTLIMSNKTKAVLLRDAIDAENYGLVAELNQGSVYGTKFIIVPSDLLPTLGTAETRTFLVHGQPVEVRDAIFYADLSAFTGRTSGGLSYDVDGRASYEVNGEVRSAFQRNEVVVRGSFFRGGVVTEPELVSSLTSAES